MRRHKLITKSSKTFTATTMNYEEVVTCCKQLDTDYLGEPIVHYTNISLTQLVKDKDIYKDAKFMFTLLSECKHSVNNILRHNLVPLRIFWVSIKEVN